MIFDSDLTSIALQIPKVQRLVLIIQKLHSNTKDPETHIKVQLISKLHMWDPNSANVNRKSGRVNLQDKHDIT